MITITPKRLDHVCVPRGPAELKKFKNTDDFKFQAITWEPLDEGEIDLTVNIGTIRSPQYADTREHAVYISGSTEDGISVSVRTVVHPYFLLKLEPGRDGKEWNSTKIERFIENEIKSNGYTNKQNITGRRCYRYTPPDPDNEDCWLSYDEKRERPSLSLQFESAIVNYYSLHLKDVDAGFTGLTPKEFQFLRINFKTADAMKKCANRFGKADYVGKLSKDGYGISVYEANLEPHIRLMHETKCESTGWITLPGGSYSFTTASERGTTTQIEINLEKWREMKPLDKDFIAPFRECSFDLETYSPDDAKFSTAEVPDNYIIQIASTFSDFNSGRPPMRVLYNLGPSDAIDEPDTLLKCFDDEKTMLLSWSRLIRNSDPDTLHAYNGWDFDFGYLAERAKVCKCWTEFSCNLGRIIALKSQKVEKIMKSKAYGDNHWKLLTMSGRVVIDPMVHIQREFKLNSYNLKSVSEEFLAQKLPKQPLTTTKDSPIVKVKHPNHGMTAGKVIHFSDVDTPDIEEQDDKVFYAIAGWTYEEIHELHTITDVISPDEYCITMPTPANKTTTGGGESVKAFETKHDISFPEMFRAFREKDAKVMSVVGRYCLSEDSQILTNKGFLFLDQILNEDRHELLICGYDPKTHEYVYESASDIIVNKKRKQAMVEFTNHNEALRWGEGSDAYGRYNGNADRNGYSNNVSLIVTPEHDMYTQSGRYRASNPGKADFFEKSRSSYFAKQKANTLLSDDEKKGIQFLAFAENGVQTNTETLPFVDILGLKSSEQINAFLSLYGYWLGDGSFIFANVDYRWNRESITFNPVKKQDVAYLIKLFNVLELVEGIDYFYSPPIKTRLQHHIKITSERYTIYFRSQYQENYKSYETTATFVESDIDRRSPEEGPKTAKWLWSWCWNLSKNQCRHLIAGLRFADGSETADRNIIYTSSARFRDEILRLCLHAGYSVRFKSMYLKGESRGIDKKSGKEFIATKDAWAVDYAVKNVIRPALKCHRDIKKVSYTGRTWCVTVPHGFIVTRRAHAVDGVITKASRPTIQGNCIQDTLLPQKILNKLCVLPNLIEMAKVTWVPLEYLITRGQQVKVFSQFTKAAAEYGYAVPTVQRPEPKEERDPNIIVEDLGDEEEENVGYVGGAVLDPIVGFYDTPIAVPDFKSLYPTTMIDNNFCYISLVKNSKYDNLPGVDYNRVTVGNKVHTFAMNIDGIVPGILVYLLNTRDKRKAMMKDAKSVLEEMIHNGAQLALKVSANSIYGFTGVSPDKATLPCMPIAESTTAKGRNGTFMTRDFLEDSSNFKEIMKYDANKDGMPLKWMYLMLNVAKEKSFHLTGEKLLALYGFTMNDLSDGKLHAICDAKGMQVWTSNGFDTITGFSMNLVKSEGLNSISNGEIKLLRVHTLTGIFFDMQKYQCQIVYGDSVTPDTPILIRLEDKLNYVNIEDIPRKGKWQPYIDGKEIAFPMDGTEVWSDKGFTPLRRIIRHKTDKVIYRVLTNTGAVCVTSDHSLLDANAKEVRPIDVKVGDSLLHSDLPAPEKQVQWDGPPLYTMGMFFGSGECNEIEWSISNPILEHLEASRREMQAFYKNDKIFTIELVSHYPIKQYILKTQQKDITKSWLRMFYTKRKQKRIPILNCAIETIEDFMKGYYHTVADNNSKEGIGAAGLFFLSQRMGFFTSVNISDNRYHLVSTKESRQKQRPTIEIKQIERLGPSVEEVYDLETDNHHFAAGVGKLVVHNTDSVFAKFDVSHLPQDQTQRVAYSTVVAGYAANCVTEYLRSLNPFKPPNKQWMELQYEKTYRFWILFSKKRYAGQMTEFDVFHYTDDKKGVAQKRRDFCTFVKEIYGKILKAFFDDRPTITREQRINNALEIVRKAIVDLLNDRVPFDKLVISKLLKDSYKLRKHAQSKSNKQCDFTPHNVFEGDIVEVKLSGFVCEGAITTKRGSNAYSNESPLSLTISKVTPSEGAPPTLSPGSSLNIQYTDIHQRNASVIHLDKIMNPKTSDKELEGITHPHVRLARRMKLRDPASAPPSGSRVPYVFCEPKSQKVLQYMRAENPEYAKKNKLKIDPVYYLKKQCANAWSQILDTACPGLVETLFNEAYDQYEKKVSRQLDMLSFINGQSDANINKIAIKQKTMNVGQVAAAPVKKIEPIKAPVTKSIASYFIKPPSKEVDAAVTAPKKIVVVPKKIVVAPKKIVVKVKDK